MDFLQPLTLDDALTLRAERPSAVPICGGTDLMVDINFDRLRPDATLDLTRLRELAQIERDADGVWIGAGVPYLRILDDLQVEAPGLCMAARTVGSPQIRARGTLGGNLGTASPAGDALPALVACGATVEVASADRGLRTIPAAEFVLAPRRSALAADELITRVHLPRPRGPQQFAKVGQRNAMVISIASFALAVDVEGRQIGTAIGSAGPRILQAPEASDFVAGALDDDAWAGRTGLPDGVAARFGELAGAAASPIDDVRGTAAYRRRAVSVVAARTLTWAWDVLRRTEVAA